MKRDFLLVGILCGVSPHTASAQFVNWEKNQINTTICTWEQPRAALIRDTIYIDGGNLWWSPGLTTGEVLPKVSDGNLGGILLTFNLSRAFDKSTNITGLLVEHKLYKGRGGSDASDSIPSFYDGAMLANNASFFLYAGVPSLQTDLYQLPDPGYVLAYEQYSYHLNKPLFQAGFKDTETDHNVSTYLAYGGGVNVPSQNKAWYFSGLQSPTGGPIYAYPVSNDTNATAVSGSLVTLDFGTQYQQKWYNQSLPRHVKGRANPEVVWVPVGKQGILVVLGGVISPEWIDTSGEHKSPDPDASRKQSSVFMQVIDIYDIDTERWYQQTTRNSPGMRTRGCATIGVASDKSSFNIYYYGGFNGIDVSDDAFYDQVWVLSLPSFTWTLLNQGKSLHARAGHRCFAPYPDQMLVLGGYTATSGGVPTCLDGGVMANFNMSSGEWLDGYDPSRWSNYTVPTQVQTAIGGHGSGGATATAPVDAAWASQGLQDVFKIEYDDAKLERWWPYPVDPNPPTTPTGSSGGKDHKGAQGRKSGLPQWLVPTVTTVLILMLLAMVAVFAFLYRGRRLFFRHVARSRRSDDAGFHIVSWVKGQRAEKSFTLASSEYTAYSAEMEDAGSLPAIHAANSRPAHEVADSPLVELDACPSPSELHNNFLPPDELKSNPQDHIQSPPKTNLLRGRFYSKSFRRIIAHVAPPRDTQTVHRHQTSPTGSARVDSPTLSISNPFSFGRIEKKSFQSVDEIVDAETPSGHRGPSSPNSWEPPTPLERPSPIADDESMSGEHDYMCSPMSPPSATGSFKAPYAQNRKYA